MLRVEYGAHTGPVRRLAVDPTASRVVTVGDDATARIWDLKTQRLQAVLRVPTAMQGSKLYGVAVSPDGREVAVGSTASGSIPPRIYIFDLASRALLRTMDAGSGDIRHLCWSQDGRYLIASYIGINGIRVFERGGKKRYEEFFSGAVYGAAISGDGMLAVPSFDGSVHLYQLMQDEVRPMGAIPLSGSDPVSVSFSPNGALLAIGYLSPHSNGNVRVDILNIKRRQMEQHFQFSDLEKGNLMNVIWQRDGKAIYAAGTGYRRGPRHIVKRVEWPSGSTTELTAGTNTITDFATLPDGKIVFSSFEPSWGVIDGHQLLYKQESPIFDLRGAERLKINSQGTQISWYSEKLSRYLTFDVLRRAWMEEASNEVHKAKVHSNHFRAIRWENNFSPEVNGKTIPLHSGEIARAVAIFPDDSAMVLASSWHVRKIDRAGNELWKIPTVTETTAVNITDAGHLIVIASSDGAIRWLRAEDGQVLMSLLPLADQRWVLWTELGHYDASIGAESLLGWQVNRTDGVTADFFGVAHFRERFYRPDIIDKVLVVSDVRQAMEQANAQTRNQAEHVQGGISEKNQHALMDTAKPAASELPPVVSLIPEGSTSKTLRIDENRISIGFSIFSPHSAPAATVQVKVNGRPVEPLAVTMPAQADGVSSGRLVLSASSSNTLVQIFATNASGLSEPLIIETGALGERLSNGTKTNVPEDGDRASRLTLSTIPPEKTISTFLRNDVNEAAVLSAVPREQSRAVQQRKPTLYILAVGVAKYANPAYTLGFPAKDATDFVDVFKRQEGRLYEKVEVRLLTDERATRQSILEGLAWLRASTSSSDVGMMFLAGHGITDIGNIYRFLPYDADLNSPTQTMVADHYIRDALAAISGKALFFVDTCYAGQAIGKFARNDVALIANKLAAPDSGVIVFSSSDGKQESLERQEWGNGAFTKALISGLKGNADFRHEGVVTQKGLDYFVSDAVRKLTHGRQTPVTIMPLGTTDFVLASTSE